MFADIRALSILRGTLGIPFSLAAHECKPGPGHPCSRDHHGQDGDHDHDHDHDQDQDQDSGSETFGYPTVLHA
ncbi:hypothetical protein GUITHDRAFT_121248 [Guillardia theta CCMP2712]|uniref:Uncharacterized protein n=1 Tax=Guillardia theta (strain CCMP2712) TaxID=905079 RepID=L1I9P7_GUITC|nr:hypothetical protein GUITHDRAFT_121248 [Guillardia theta CCMP2712]EKX32580.1 hypothetical protein GUITHDRAFT_121248 [Guillardia theta CCMP2712]|eukprot:XP_005819560.1 hypothetical protein GUITHDRAFT_121248 [Guillardia theta CCMP2712]